MRPLILAGALLTAIALSTGVARADVNDDAFIQVIDEQHITYTSEENLIAAGHAVCNGRAMGYTDMQIVADVLAASELDPYNAGFFVGAAEAAYCPQYSSGGPLKRAV